MPAGIEIYNYVTNQKGSPAIWSDIFAARPPAGFIGRLFISTDTFEIYRDTGVSWDLIGGSGGPTVNIYNSDGSLTGARVVTMAGNNLTFEGGASTARIAMSANNNVPRIFSFRTAGVPRWAFRIDGNETGSNIGGDFALRAYDDAGTFTISPFSVERRTGEKSLFANETLTTSTANLTGVYNLTTATVANGVLMTGGNPQAASHNNYTVVNSGAYTVADSIFFGAQSNVLRLTSGATGTATITQTGSVRVAAANLNQVQYNTVNGSGITYTHVAVSQNLGIYALSASGSLTITNAYGLVINDLNEYGNLNLVLCLRWAIYQDSVNDVNYLGGTTLIGTTVNAGFKLDVSGTMRNTLGATFASTSGNVGIGLTAFDKLDVNGAIRIRGNTTNFVAAQSGVIDFVSTSIFPTAPVMRIYSIGDATNNGSIAFGTGTTSTPNERMRIIGNGNVGINTTTPGARLDIVGDVRINSSMNLVPTTTVPTATAGTLYYDSATNKLKLHDGTSFVDLN